nr:PREDICTED: uncharacterized protein LOC100883880 isoform X1 [Megachile rotundata]
MSEKRDNLYHTIKRLFGRHSFQKVRGYEDDMTWFTIFTTLLAVQFTVGISDVVVIIPRLEDVVTLQLEEEYGIENCEVETSTGQKYQYIPIGFGSIIDRKVFPDSSRTCDIRIKNVALEDAGLWKITTYFNTTDRPPVTKTFKLLVAQEIGVVPGPITVTGGYFAYVKLDMDKRNVTRCVVNVMCESTKRKHMQIDLLSDNTTDFERFGPCGFKMLAHINSTHICTPSELVAVVEDKFVYTSKVKINIVHNIEKPEKMEITTLDRGKSGKVIFSAKSRTTFCQLEGPMGLKSLLSEDCIYNIPAVTNRHDGIWTARYGIRGNPVPIIERFRVVVRDARKIDTNVTVTENNEIQLSCHVYGEQGVPYSFCNFIRPDGYVLNLEPGIGTERYRAFNVSQFDKFGRISNVNCGLVISQPKQYDYGGWKCGIGSYQFYIGSIIYVDPRIINANETYVKEIEVVTENVYVKRNDSFQIKCTADKALSYCWFQSPNGTSYSVSKNQKQSPTTLPYVGLGLKLGECVVQIDHATHADHGEWTCNLGVLDGPEKSQKLFVNVTESYVIPEHSILVANYEDDITLSCGILPNLTDIEVVYCRWIHPDGHGIHNSLSQRYMVSQTDTQCRLMIPSKYSEESIGRWTCVAGLYGLRDEEAWATITVHSQSTTTYCIITIISVIASLLMIFCIASYIYVHRKRRMPTEDSSCTYNDKSNLVQFFGKIYPVIGKCNKSISQTNLE